MRVRAAGLAARDQPARPVRRARSRPIRVGPLRVLVFLTTFLPLSMNGSRRSSSNYNGNGAAGTSKEPNGLLVLIPIYNDWDAVGLLLPAWTGRWRAPVSSPTSCSWTTGPRRPPAHWPANHGVPWAASRCWRCAECRTPAGDCHRAGVRRTTPSRAPLVVMDGDGEDAPEDVPRLLACLEENPEQGGVRRATTRSESLMFRVF